MGEYGVSSQFLVCIFSVVRLSSSHVVKVWLKATVGCAPVNLELSMHALGFSGGKGCWSSFLIDL